MDRYTRKDAERAYIRLRDALGKKENVWTREGNENRPVVGGWNLDWNPTYGGGVVEEICNENGGVNMPLGYQRRNAREFVAAVQFALDVLRVASPNGVFLK